MDEMARMDRAQLGPVSTEGDSVRQRRERIGLAIVDVATRAGVNRDTVAAIEEGKGFRRSSLTKIERALSEAEEELGMGPVDEPQPAEGEPRTVVIELGEGRGRVAVSGPVEDSERLVAIALELFRREQGD